MAKWNMNDFPSRGFYDPVPIDEAERIESALMGPHPACPHCGTEDRPTLIRRPTLALAWIIVSAGHKAPCGLSCGIPGATYIGEFHVGMSGCPRCKLPKGAK